MCGNIECFFRLHGKTPSALLFLEVIYRTFGCSTESDLFTGKAMSAHRQMAIRAHGRCPRELSWSKDEGSRTPRALPDWRD